MLMTAPVRDWQVVLSKFVACFLFYVVLWIPTMVYWPVLTNCQAIPSVDWKWTKESIPVAIAAAACLSIFLVNVLPLSAKTRLVLLILLSLAPPAAYVWFYDVDIVPNFVDFAADQKAMVIAVQAIMILLAFGVTFLLPFAIARAFEERFETSVLFVGWLQFALAFVYVVVHLARTHNQGDFQPIHFETEIDARPLGVSYLGVMLAGAMFLALGLFVSSLVKSQMVAALISLILSLLFIVAGFWRPEMDPSDLYYRVIFYLSVPMHFSRDFTRGILNIGHLVLYTTMTLFFLFMTVRSLESRRWK